MDEHLKDFVISAVQWGREKIRYPYLVSSNFTSSRKVEWQHNLTEPHKHGII